MTPTPPAPPPPVPPPLPFSSHSITDFSGELQLPSEELADDFKDWGFEGEPAGFRDELMQFVQKSSTQQILRSMEAPAAVLAQLDDSGKAELDGSATKSPHASSAGSHVSDHSETGSWSKDNQEIEDWDSDDEKVEDDR